VSKIVRLGIVLFVITAVTGLILGGVYTMTLEPIRAAKEREKMEALSATLPGATDFKKIEVKGAPGIIKEVNEGTADGKVIGYNITVTPKGYSGPIEMVVGISSDGRLMDIRILAHNETPGLGAKAPGPAFSGQFKNKKADALKVTKTAPASDNEIQAISGATITSTAVVTGVNAALDYWKTVIREGGNTAPGGLASKKGEGK
jgi:electron transport complex protein RnfG